jgi:hypothetical protein
LQNFEHVYFFAYCTCRVMYVCILELGMLAYGAIQYISALLS